MWGRRTSVLKGVAADHAGSPAVTGIARFLLEMCVCVCAWKQQVEYAAQEEQAVA